MIRVRIISIFFLMLLLYNCDAGNNKESHGKDHEKPEGKCCLFVCVKLKHVLYIVCV